MPGEEGAFFASLGEGSLEEGRELALRIRTEIAQELNLPAHLGLATGKITARALVDFGFRISDFGIADGEREKENGRMGDPERLTILSCGSGSPTPRLSHSPNSKSEIRNPQSPEAAMRRMSRRSFLWAAVAGGVTYGAFRWLHGHVQAQRRHSHQQSRGTCG